MNIHIMKNMSVERNSEDLAKFEKTLLLSCKRIWNILLYQHYAIKFINKLRNLLSDFQRFSLNSHSWIFFNDEIYPSCPGKVFHLNSLDSYLYLEDSLLPVKCLSILLFWKYSHHCQRTWSSRLPQYYR